MPSFPLRHCSCRADRRRDTGFYQKYHALLSAGIGVFSVALTLREIRDHVVYYESLAAIVHG